jgi:hypothetical protein
MHFSTAYSLTYNKLNRTAEDVFVISMKLFAFYCQFQLTSDVLLILIVQLEQFIAI